MPRFRSVPREIVAEQFDYNKTWPQGVLIEENTLRAYVITAHKQAVHVVTGDWIVPEPDGSGYYPIKDHLMSKSWILIEEPTVIESQQRVPISKEECRKCLEKLCKVYNMTIEEISKKIEVPVEEIKRRAGI